MIQIKFTGITRFKMDKLFIIKIGGNIIDDEKNLSSFLADFAGIRATKILVHGGGKTATKIGDRLGIKSNYINGRRVTDNDTIDLVTMVYGGLINKKITAQLQALQCNAIGLCGADMNMIPAVKRPLHENEDIDYGWVGNIDNAQLTVTGLQLLLDNKIVPVIAPLTHDSNGHILNTNADTIAASVAITLSKLYDVRLIYCFEKKGVLENIHDENSVIRHITKKTYCQLLNEQKLFAGILPKIDNALAATEAGVNEVLIGDAGNLLQNTNKETTGTLITK